MGWQNIYKARKFSYSMRPDSMQEHQVLDLLPRKKCIIKEKLTLFELLNGLISLKHHDVITVVENRPQLSHQKVAKTHHIIFGAKIQMKQTHILLNAKCDFLSRFQPVWNCRGVFCNIERTGITMQGKDQSSHKENQIFSNWLV